MPAIRRCIQGAAERDWRSILAVRQYGARTPLVYDEGNGRRSKQAAILLFSNIVNNNAQKQGRGGVPPADRELSPIYPVDTVTTLSGRDKDKRPSFSLWERWKCCKSLPSLGSHQTNEPPGGGLTASAGSIELGAAIYVAIPEGGNTGPAGPAKWLLLFRSRGMVMENCSAIRRPGRSNCPTERPKSATTCRPPR